MTITAHRIFMRSMANTKLAWKLKQAWLKDAFHLVHCVRYWNGRRFIVSAFLKIGLWQSNMNH